MTPDQRIELRKIFRAVASKHGIEEADLYVRDRTNNISKARWEAWARCRIAGYSLKVIADLAGWDHTAVMHGANNHRATSVDFVFKSARTA